MNVLNVSRRGKVARLSQAVRDELNRRIHDGEPAATLLPWLNGLPAVQSVLAEHFANRPITASNLSEWRLGGWQDWLHALLQTFASLPPQTPEPPSAPQSSLNSTPKKPEIRVIPI